MMAAHDSMTDTRTSCASHEKTFVYVAHPWLFAAADGTVITVQHNVCTARTREPVAVMPCPWSRSAVIFGSTAAGSETFTACRLRQGQDAMMLNGMRVRVGVCGGSLTFNQIVAGCRGAGDRSLRFFGGPAALPHIGVHAELHARGCSTC